MLTSRGWSLLMTALVLLAIGVLAPSQCYLIGIMGLTLVLWIAYEWVRFAMIVRLTLPQVTFRRILRIDNRDVSMVWSNRSFQVIVEIDGPKQFAIPYLLIEDWLPTETMQLDGGHRVAVSLRPGDELMLTYILQAESAGLLRFEGQRIELADIQGFFSYRTFRRQPLEVPVLPPLSSAEGQQRTTKRANTLPPPGIHRLRLPGSGSELHDLREYRDGDPPKMIAWKASARRDRLIIKEFENEVPVRCTIFLDISESVRLGPPGKHTLSRLVAIVAGVAQAAAINRDLVGLVMFDEQTTQVTRPARGPRHLVELTTRLGKAAGRTAVGRSSYLAAVGRLALSLAHEVYPDLLHRSVNRLPWKMHWRPLLDSTRGWWVIALIALPFLIFFPPYARMLKNIASFSFPSPPARGFMFLFLIVLPWILAAFGWIGYGLSGFLRMKATNRRKRMAALLTQVLNLPAGDIALMQVDDDALSLRLQQFLALHHIEYPIALYDAEGRYQFRSVEKVRVLAVALLNAVSRARDNELFVLVADLLELDEDIEPLMKTVRTALGRHHQVMLICPWLPKMPTPEQYTPPPLHLQEPPRDIDEIESVLAVIEVTRYHAAYERVRSAFGRLGVTVIRMDAHDTVARILQRLEQLRVLGIRR